MKRLCLDDHPSASRCGDMFVPSTVIRLTQPVLVISDLSWPYRGLMSISSVDTVRRHAHMRRRHPALLDWGSKAVSGWGHSGRPRLPVILFASRGTGQRAPLPVPTKSMLPPCCSRRTTADPGRHKQAVSGAGSRCRLRVARDSRAAQSSIWEGAMVDCRTLADSSQPWNYLRNRPVFHKRPKRQLVHTLRARGPR
jgi:hypothetical protein